jgi:hypothetical protein
MCYLPNTPFVSYLNQSNVVFMVLKSVTIFGPRKYQITNIEKFWTSSFGPIKIKSNEFKTSQTKFQNVLLGIFYLAIKFQFN